MAVIRKTKANISFKYSNRLKTLYKKGKIKVPTGFYGDVLTKDNTTLEHIVPHSLGGKTVEDNLVLSSSRTNNLRGNKELRLFSIKKLLKNIVVTLKMLLLKTSMEMSMLEK